MKKIIFILLAVFIVSGCVLFAANSKRGRSNEMAKLVKYNDIYMSDGGEKEFKTSSPDQEYMDFMANKYYYYNLLKESEKEAYNAIYATLQGYRDYVPIGIRKDKADVVFNCVMNDHPELFYVKGYELKDDNGEIYIKGLYNRTPEEADEAAMQINHYVLSVLDEIYTKQTQYEKVKYIYEYIIKNTVYDVDAEDSQNICSVMINGISVCQGYTKAFQYLCQKANISATLVTGYIRSSKTPHSWNAVYLDGEWYYVDCTFGDIQPNNYLGIIYDYLLITTDDILTTHSINNILQEPRCTSMKYNYFIREDKYLQEYSPPKLREIFNGSAHSVQFKCLSKEVYDEAFNTLVNNYDVYRFVEGNVDEYVYMKNDDMDILSFIFKEEEKQ